MKILLEQIDSNEDKILFFFCPGCRNYHSIRVAPAHKANSASWSWNGDLDKPTFTPSLLSSAGTERQCHLYVREGMIQYLDDCVHELRGQTVPMESVE